MSTPILIPAWSEVLRRGLPARTLDGRDVLIAAIDKAGVLCLVVALIGEYDDSTYVKRESLRLDLRDPAVRDAVLRAMLRTLQPSEPEPFSAPRFEYDADTDNWYLLDGAEIQWSWNGFDRASDHQVAALRDLTDCSDRDLLALVACAMAVFGGDLG